MTITAQFILVFLLGLFIGFSIYAKLIMIDIKALLKKQEFSNQIEKEVKENFALPPKHPNPPKPPPKRIIKNNKQKANPKKQNH